MPFSSAQAKNPISKVCNAFEFGLTFIPDDNLHVWNPLERSLDAIAECLRALEHSMVKVRDEIAHTVGVAMLAGSSIN